MNADVEGWKAESLIAVRLRREPGQVTRLALATSQKQLPASDLMLIRALTDEGLDVRHAIWSEPHQSWQEFDAVLVRSCWDYHLRAEEFLRWVTMLERQGMLVLNDPDLIRWNANKVYLRELAADGIAVPKAIFVESHGRQLDLQQICAARGWSGAVVKPLISASAHCTELRCSGLVRGPAMVQQYVATIETEGEWSLVYFNHHFSHAVVKKPRSGDFRVQSAFGGTVRVAQPSRQLLGFAEDVLDRLVRPAMFARVDIVVEEPFVRLMELEVIEPELFLSLVPGSSERLAAEIRSYLSQVLPRI